MRKIIPAFVLFAMLFNAAGYYIVYEFNHYLIRREFKTMLEHGSLDRELTVLRVFDPPSDPAFRRVEEHEIVYRGNLYDIAREVPQGKVITFYCIHDKKEEALIAGLKNTHHSKKATDLLQHLVSIALPVTWERSHPQSTKKFIYPALPEHFNTHIEPTFSPPPENS